MPTCRKDSILHEALGLHCLVEPYLDSRALRTHEAAAINSVVGSSFLIGRGLQGEALDLVSLSQIGGFI